MNAPIDQPIVLLLLKCTLLLLTAMIAARFARRASAAARHLLWASAITGVLLLPFLTLSLPSWRVAYAAHSAPSEIPAAPQTTGVLPIVSQPRASSVSEPSSVGSHVKASVAAAAMNNLSMQKAMAAESQPAPLHPLSSHPTSWLALLGVVWLAGCVVTLARLAFGLRLIVQAKNGGVDLVDVLAPLIQNAKAVAGVRRSVTVRRAAPGGIVVPITWGVIRPVILLPAQSAEWSDDCLRSVLLHELAHIGRGDWLTQCAAHLACAIYWFHPLVWIASRQMRETSERACDDCVLRAGVAPTEYAQRLIDVLKSLPSGANPRTVAIAMALPRETEGRIRAILASGIPRRAPSRKRILAAAVLSVAIVLPISALRPFARTYAAAPSRKPPIDLAEAGALIDLASAPMPATPTKFETRRRSRGILTFVYLREVACQRDQNRPVTMNIERDGKGVDIYSFHDARTKKTFHDGPAYRNLIARSPVILTDADIVAARAEMSGATGHEPTVGTTYSAEGARKFAAWTTAHVGELMGIVVDGRILSAPNITEPITGTESQISGGFRNLAEALALAARLNAGKKTAVHTIGESAKPVVTNIGDTYMLLSGAIVRMAGVRRAVHQGSVWNISQNSWWSADGRPVSAPDTSGPRYWTKVGDANWTIPFDPWTKDIPYQFYCAVQSPVTDYSEYREVVSGDDLSGRIKRANAPDHKVNSMESLPPDAKSCSVRVGVATGPWQTVSTLPVAGDPAFAPSRLADAKHPTALILYDSPSLRYLDNAGKTHVEPLLPAGAVLGNVARRLVAVYRNGSTVSLDGNPTPEVTLRINDGIYRLALKAVRENIISFQLQTRPYDIVEFQNISLHPTATVASD